MTHQERIARAMAAAIEDVNQQQPAGKALAHDEKTVLFGDGGALDSLGLVCLIAATEVALAAEFGAAVTLADDRALSWRSSPFRTVGTLQAWVCELLGETSRA